DADRGVRGYAGAVPEEVPARRPADGAPGLRRPGRHAVGPRRRLRARRMAAGARPGAPRWAVHAGLQAPARPVEDRPRPHRGAREIAGALTDGAGHAHGAAGVTGVAGATVVAGGKVTGATPEIAVWIWPRVRVAVPSS